MNLFPNSSMVEHLAVNEAVLGSSFSLGALVRWLSGLKQEFTKLSMDKTIRGFESYSHRYLLTKISQIYTIFANEKIPNIISYLLTRFLQINSHICEHERAK